MSELISGKRRLPHEQLQINAARVARGLNRLGVGEGDAIAMVLRNDFAFFEAAFGAGLVGAYAVPINWHFKADEVRYILEDSGAKLVIVHADLLPQLEGGIPDDVTVLGVTTPPEIAAAYQVGGEAARVPGGTSDWDDWLAGFEPWQEEPRAARGNVIYTSGTTGNPKGVFREPSTPEMAAASMAIYQKLGAFLEPSNRTVVTGPVYHSAPNAFALSAVGSGAGVILQPRFDPEELLKTIEEERITHLHMVPTMFVRLLKLPEEVKGRYDLSSLQFVVHAAAPCPPDVKKGMIEWWGPIIHEYYGGTESGAVVFCNSGEALRKPGTVGRALPGCVIKIIDENDRECAPGDVGEIFVVNQEGPDFTYRNQEDKRREMDRGGLMTLGDVGYLDEDGFLFISDRVRDMVISGGVNIYPAEIEGVLIGMEGVKDCAVFGIPDDEYGETLCAHIDVDPAIIKNEAEIRTWLGEKLAIYKVPRRIVFDTALPREDSGKIMKRKIREGYWVAADRKI